MNNAQCNFRIPLSHIITKALVSKGLISPILKEQIEKAILNSMDDYLVILYDIDYVPEAFTESEARLILRQVEADFDIDEGVNREDFINAWLKLAQEGKIDKSKLFW